MFKSTFLPSTEQGIITGHHHDHTTTPNTYPSPNYLVDNNYFSYNLGFEFSDYPNIPDEQPLISNVEDSNISSLTTPFTQEMASSGSSISSIDRMQEEGGGKKVTNKAEVDEENIVAIRTMTKLEILDDGYKWRKYGKKMVKSNPNPRHYFKCSTGGCKVKKIVERDGEDSSYLITTYKGRHNHESPCVIYSDELPMAFSYG